MSTCISREGEYGAHGLGEGAERFTCTRCYVFDEDAAMAALAQAEKERDEAQEHVAYHLRDYALNSELTGDLAVDMASYAGRLKVERDELREELRALLGRAAKEVWSRFRPAAQSEGIEEARWEHAEDVARLSWDRAEAAYWDHADDCRPFDPTDVVEDEPDAKDWLDTVREVLDDAVSLGWRSPEAVDGLANTCTHMAASGIDTAPFGPDKVWRCDHCGLTWKQGDRA